MVDKKNVKEADVPTDRFRFNFPSESKMWSIGRKRKKKKQQQPPTQLVDLENIVEEIEENIRKREEERKDPPTQLEEIDVSQALQRKDELPTLKGKSLLPVVEFDREQLREISKEVQSPLLSALKVGFHSRADIRVDAETAAVFSLNVMMYATAIMHTQDPFLVQQLSRVLKSELDVLRVSGVVDGNGKYYDVNGTRQKPSSF